MASESSAAAIAVDSTSGRPYYMKAGTNSVGGGAAGASAAAAGTPHLASGKLPTAAGSWESGKRPTALHSAVKLADARSNHHSAISEAEILELAGVDPTVCSLDSDAAAVARAELQQWISSQALERNDHSVDPWPCYLLRSEEACTEPCQLLVRVTIQHAGSTLQHTHVRPSTSTVKELVTTVLSKFSRTLGKALTSNADNCLFQVTGFQDFLLYDTLPLDRYVAVAQAARSPGRGVLLTLLVLSDEDAAKISERRASAVLDTHTDTKAEEQSSVQRAVAVADELGVAADAAGLPSPAAAPVSLIGWVPYLDEAGQVFFYKSESQTSQRGLPDGLTQNEDGSYTVASTADAISVTPVARPAHVPLPSGSSGGAGPSISPWTAVVLTKQFARQARSRQSVVRTFHPEECVETRRPGRSSVVPGLLNVAPASPIVAPLVEASESKDAARSPEQVSLQEVVAPPVTPPEAPMVPAPPMSPSSDHDDAHSRASDDEAHDEVQASIPHTEVGRAWRVCVQAVANLSLSALGAAEAGGTATGAERVTGLVVEAGLFFGGRVLSGTGLSTEQAVTVPAGSVASFNNTWLESGCPISAIPPPTRLVLVLVGLTARKERIALAAASLQLYDEQRRYNGGQWALRMWPVPPEAAGEAGIEKLPLHIRQGIAVENVRDDTSPVILVDMDQFLLPVVALTPVLDSIGEFNPADSVDSLSSISNPALRALVERDPLMDRLNGFTPDEAQLLWTHRKALVGFAVALPKVLRVVDWSSSTQVAEAHRMLCIWSPPDMELAVLLLEGSFGDEVVRSYAVRCLGDVSDQQLLNLLPQLVQALKYEPYHNTVLARFLLRRALQSPLCVGHPMFWLLRSEMKAPGVNERFGVLLEAYLNNCGAHRWQLWQQHVVNAALEKVAVQAQALPKARRTDFARAEIRSLTSRLPTRFSLCLSSRLEASGIVVEECKVMDSKKAPLWIVFHNADPTGEPIPVIFKAGDDLRQDLMTLQALRYMDRLWQATGLDLRMNPYGCVGTGDEVGMIEVVKSSDTTARIQAVRVLRRNGAPAVLRDHMPQKFGGRIAGAWVGHPIGDFLREHNQSDPAYETAVKNFVLSCAGYCVATFVLGIGDRHPSNIMVTRDGHLFHIDFGHFLGNFKEKSVLGVKVRRERAPFVFTKQMAHVMGGPGDPLFSQFEGFCSQAYNMLRKQAPRILAMFMMMVPAGMPELEHVSDLLYLQEKLNLPMSDAEATAEFKDEIKNALNSTSRHLDNMVHQAVHKS